jgi:hypothetical protein
MVVVPLSVITTGKLCQAQMIGIFTSQMIGMCLNSASLHDEISWWLCRYCRQYSSAEVNVQVPIAPRDILMKASSNVVLAIPQSL